MSDKKYFEGSKNPANIARSAAFDLAFYRNNPDYFDPSGIWVFCGSQGSGKTLSAVQTAQKLLAEYPKALFVSNIALNGFDRDIIPFTAYEQIEGTKNGIHGVVFLIDEIHILFNSLESKNIPFTEIANFCQMRKDRRVIIGTSQVYGRIAKPMREQLKYVIMCRSFLKYIQFNTVIDMNADGYTGEDDGHFEGEIIKKSIWFHKPENYMSYDTLEKVQRIDRKKGGVPVGRY